MINQQIVTKLNNMLKFCLTREDVCTVVTSVLNLWPENPKYDMVVDSICEKKHIGQSFVDNAPQQCIDEIYMFLESLYNSGINLHPFDHKNDDIQENLNSLSLDIYTFYNKRKNMNMSNVVKLCNTNSFEIKIKSIKPFLKILEKYE